MSAGHLGGREVEEAVVGSHVEGQVGEGAHGVLQCRQVSSSVDGERLGSKEGSKRVAREDLNHII